MAATCQLLPKSALRDIVQALAIGHAYNRRANTSDNGFELHGILPSNPSQVFVPILR